MHGELIEFNERLHRALMAKEALVSQMRQELIDLRGPVGFFKKCSLTLSKLTTVRLSSWRGGKFPEIILVYIWLDSENTKAR